MKGLLAAWERRGLSATELPRVLHLALQEEMFSDLRDLCTKLGLQESIVKLWLSGKLEPPGYIVRFIHGALTRRVQHLMVFK